MQLVLATSPFPRDRPRTDGCRVRLLQKLINHEAMRARPVPADHRPLLALLQILMPGKVADTRLTNKQTRRRIRGGGANRCSDVVATSTLTCCELRNGLNVVARYAPRVYQPCPVSPRSAARVFGHVWLERVFFTPTILLCFFPASLVPRGVFTVLLPKKKSPTPRRIHFIMPGAGFSRPDKGGFIGNDEISSTKY